VRNISFERAARPLMLAFVATVSLVEPSCGSRTTVPVDEAKLASLAAFSPDGSGASSGSLSFPAVPASASASVASAPALPANDEGQISAASSGSEGAPQTDSAAVEESSSEVALPEAAAAEPAPAAVEIAVAPVEPAPVEPAPVPATLAAPAAPAPQVAVPAPAPAFAGGWQPVQAQRRAFDPEIERWRQLVREEIAQASVEGRLGGGATRLDDDLILAMMQQESGGDSTAESWAGAVGLLQLMPETFAGLIYGDYSRAYSTPMETFLDPRLNVRAGVRYMAEALQVHRGNVYWALASYNAGIGATQAWRGVGLPAVPPIGGYTETAAYAPAILSNYAYHRPGTDVAIPDPIPSDQIPAVIALLTNAGLW
jgi:soluble lytic murein transglycosylase-like protein